MTKDKLYLKPKYEKPIRLKKSDWSLIKFHPFKGGGFLRNVKYSVYFDKTNKEYYYCKHSRSQKHKFINSYSDAEDAFKSVQLLNNNIRK